MENRKHQFLGFVIILLIIGFLNYFRRIVDGHKFTKYGKVLYLSTMITFTTGVMFVLYYTDLNNLLSFCIGLCVATASEHIAKLFITFGNNFNLIIAKVIKKYIGIDLTEELKVTETKGKSHGQTKKSNIQK